MKCFEVHGVKTTAFIDEKYIVFRYRWFIVCFCRIAAILRYEFTKKALLLPYLFLWNSHDGKQIFDIFLHYVREVTSLSFLWTLYDLKSPCLSQHLANNKQSLFNHWWNYIIINNCCWLLLFASTLWCSVNINLYFSEYAVHNKIN